MKGFEQECLDAGYSGYFSKPIDINRFMKLMADLLGGKPLEKASEIDSSVSSPPDRQVEAAPAAGLPPIVSKLPANNERFQSLIARFIARLHERLDAVEKSHRRGKQAEVADFAHWLKGAGGSVGFDALTAPASQLEKLAKAGGQEAAVDQTIGELRALAMRLAGPGTVPLEGSAASSGPPMATTPAREVHRLRPAPLVAKPVISRLGDNPRLQGVICKFIAKLEGELERAESALAKGDLAVLALIAHWLKGAGGTVGFDEFTTPAAELETFAKAAQAAQAGQVLKQLKALSEAIVPPSITHAGTANKQTIETVQVANSN